jgi:Ca-activated chloride channel family protein
LTEDPEILRSMLDALSAEIMPVEGANLPPALEMARMELEASATPGTILLVTDGIEPAELSALEQQDDTPVITLFAAPESEALGALEAAEASDVVRLTSDNIDLGHIQQLANSAYQASSLGNEKLEWEDRGWVFAWFGALLIAMWFRQGWTVRWSMGAGVFSLSLFQPSPAQADAVDWFLTQDQQGMLAYGKQDYEAAADAFQDPMWRAQSLMQMAKFEEAADILSHIDTPEAAFAEGFCWQKAQYFQQSIRAYERAVALRPDYPDAEHNLMLARAVARLLDPGRKQDTEGDQNINIEGGESRPEDFGDAILTPTNQKSATAQTQFTTAEEWMRAVDTDMGEFLKVRFKMEARDAKQ